MRRAKPMQIGEIIDRMIDSTGMRPTVEKLNVESVWPAVVGPSIMAYTRRVWLDGKTLHVQLSSAALKEELGYMRDTLVKYINDTLGRKAVVAVIIH